MRPMLWLTVLLGVSVVGYLYSGTTMSGDGHLLSLRDPADICRVCLYGLRTMLFLHPKEFLLGDIGRTISTVDAILGPTLAGLAALAIRQRLRR